MAMRTLVATSMIGTPSGDTSLYRFLAMCPSGEWIIWSTLIGAILLCVLFTLHRATAFQTWCSNAIKTSTAIFPIRDHEFVGCVKCCVLGMSNHCQWQWQLARRCTQKGIITLRVLLCKATSTQFNKLSVINTKVWAIRSLRSIRQCDYEARWLVGKLLTKIFQEPGIICFPGRSHIETNIFTESTTCIRRLIALVSHWMRLTFIPGWLAKAGRRYLCARFEANNFASLSRCYRWTGNACVPWLLSNVKARCHSSRRMVDGIFGSLSQCVKYWNQSATSAGAWLRTSRRAFLLDISAMPFVTSQRSIAETIPRRLSSLFATAMVAFNKVRWIATQGQRWNEGAAAAFTRNLWQCRLTPFTPGSFVGEFVFKHGLYCTRLACIAAIIGYALITRDFISLLLLSPVVFGAYIAPSTRSSGALITAAIWNQDVVANPIAIYAGAMSIASQAALDFIYAGSGTQLARLVKGTALQVPRINAAANAWEFATPSSVDVQIFNANGTWTKPSGANAVWVYLVAGGGGGGSGRKGLNGTNRNGGGGGGGGGISRYQWPASMLGATETVTRGAGGAGGASQTTNSTDGNDGSPGGDSSFGTFLIAKGGSAGGKGQQGGGGLAGAGGTGYDSAGTSGGAWNAVGVNTDSTSRLGPTGGGGGGLLDTVDADTGGYVGGAYTAATIAFNRSQAGGAATNGFTAAQRAGVAVTVNEPAGGTGGGGGQSQSTVDGIGGGVGGIYGGGGGGGGASKDAVGNSGAGGAGGAGIVIVVTVK